MLMDPLYPTSTCPCLAGRNRGEMMAAPTTVTDKETCEYYEKQDDGEAIGGVC